MEPDLPEFVDTIYVREERQLAAERVEALEMELHMKAQTARRYASELLLRMMELDKQCYHLSGTPSHLNSQSALHELTTLHSPERRLHAATRPSLPTTPSGLVLTPATPPNRDLPSVDLTAAFEEVDVTTPASMSDPPQTERRTDVSDYQPTPKSPLPVGAPLPIPHLRHGTPPYRTLSNLRPPHTRHERTPTGTPPSGGWERSSEEQDQDPPVAETQRVGQEAGKDVLPPRLQGNDEDTTHRGQQVHRDEAPSALQDEAHPLDSYPEHRRDHREYHRDDREHPRDQQERPTDHREHHRDHREHHRDHREHHRDHREHHRDHREHHRDHREHHRDHREHHRDHHEHPADHREHHRDHHEHPADHREHHRDHHEHPADHREHHRDDREHRRDDREHRTDHRTDHQGQADHQGHPTTAPQTAEEYPLPVPSPPPTPAEPPPAAQHSDEDKEQDHEDKEQDHEDKEQDHEDKEQDHEDKEQDHEDKEQDHEDKEQGHEEGAIGGAEDRSPPHEWEVHESKAAEGEHGMVRTGVPPLDTVESCPTDEVEESGEHSRKVDSPSITTPQASPPLSARRSVSFQELHDMDEPVGHALAARDVVRQLFDAFDVDRDGVLSAAEHRGLHDAITLSPRPVGDVLSQLQGEGGCTREAAERVLGGATLQQIDAVKEALRRHKERLDDPITVRANPEGAVPRSAHSSSSTTPVSPRSARRSSSSSRRVAHPKPSPSAEPPPPTPSETPSGKVEAGTTVLVAEQSSGPWYRGKVVGTFDDRIWVQPDDWEAASAFKHVRLANP